MDGKIFLSRIVKQMIVFPVRQYSNAISPLLNCLREFANQMFFNTPDIIRCCDGYFHAWKLTQVQIKTSLKSRDNAGIEPVRDNLPFNVTFS